MMRKFIIKDMNDSGKLKNEIYQCLIDIVSTCNLSCPTCPQGNMDSIRGGLMQPDLFRKIVSKLKSDYPHITNIRLYNWTEPLLHNKLAEFVEIVKKADLECHISANLSHIKNLEDVIKKDLNSIVISVSGFTQEVYQIGHRNGNIETVKQNMKTLSNLIKKYHTSTKVTVFYLKYKHNLGEISAMKEYALSLGFNFQTFWADLMNVEMMLQYLNTPEKIDKATMDVIQFLGNEPREFLNSLKPHDKGRCHLRENQLVLNAAGEVQLCCGSLTPLYLKESYLDLTPEQIYSRRHNSDLCKSCMNAGIHTMARTQWSDDEMVFSSKFKKNKYTRKTLKIFRKSRQLLKNSL